MSFDDDEALKAGIAASLNQGDYYDSDSDYDYATSLNKGTPVMESKKPGSLNVGLSNAGNQCYYNAFIHWALSFDEVRDFLLNGEMATMDHTRRVKHINDRIKEINREIEQTNKSIKEKIDETYTNLPIYSLEIIKKMGVTEKDIFNRYSFETINIFVNKMDPKYKTDVIKNINDYTTATLNRGTIRQLPDTMKNNNENEVEPRVEAFAYMIEFLKSTIDKINKTTSSSVDHTPDDLENMGRCQWRIISPNEKNVDDTEESFVKGKPVYDGKNKPKMWPDTNTPILEYWYSEPNDTAELASVFIDHLVLFEHNKTKFYDLFKYESISTKVCYIDRPYPDKFYDTALIQLSADTKKAQLISDIFKPIMLKQSITEFPDLCYLHNPVDNLKIVGLLFDHIKNNLIPAESKKNSPKYNTWFKGFESLKNGQTIFNETYNNGRFSKYVVINALKFNYVANEGRIPRKSLGQLEYKIKLADETSLNLKTVCLHFGNGQGGGHWQFYRFNNENEDFVLLSDRIKKDCTPVTCEHEIDEIKQNGSLFTYENPAYKPIDRTMPLELDNAMSDSIANISTSMSTSKVIEEVKPIPTDDGKTMKESVEKVANSISAKVLSTTDDDSAMKESVEKIASSMSAEVLSTTDDDSVMEGAVETVASSMSTEEPALVPEESQAKTPIKVTVMRTNNSMKITSNGKEYNMSFDLLKQLGVNPAYLTNSQ